MRSADVVELLERVPVFSTLVQTDLERISELAVPRRFEPGHVVFREGDASDTCYIVREGYARAAIGLYGPDDTAASIGSPTVSSGR